MMAFMNYGQLMPQKCQEIEISGKKSEFLELIENIHPACVGDGVIFLT